MTQQLQQIIDAAWEDRANLSPTKAPKEVADAVEHVTRGISRSVYRHDVAVRVRAPADQVGDRYGPTIAQLEPEGPVDLLDAAAVQTEPHENMGPICLFSQFDCHR